MSLLKRIGGSGPLDGQNVDSQQVNTGQLGGANSPAPAPGTTVLPRQQTGRVGAPTEDSSRRATGVTTQESMLELKKRVQQKLIAELDPKLDLTKTDEVRRNVEDIFGQILEQENIILSRVERARLFEAVAAEMLGFAPIAQLVKDNSINDIV